MRRGRLRRSLAPLAALGAVVAIAGCAAPRPAGICRPDRPWPAADTVELIDHGWHTDLALPSAGLTGPLARFRTIFPGVRVLVVGFGRRSFMTAPVTTVADLLVGPLPGHGVVLVTGLDADPASAYGSGTLLRLRLDRHAREGLDRFVWETLSHDRAGWPEALGPGPWPGSVFYTSRRPYSGLATCNTWTARALAAGGVPLSARLDVFAAQTMRRAAPWSTGGVCRIARFPTPPASVRKARPAAT